MAWHAAPGRGHPCDTLTSVIQRNLSYDPDLRARQFDFMRPAGEDVVPLVVLIHGGGWISGDRSSFESELPFFVEQGLACATISYRLAPLYPFPAAVSDVLAFLAHARTHAAELGIDPSGIVVMGNSAGGHLACMAGLCTTDPATGETVQPANGVVSICAITDLRQPETNHFPVAASFLEQFMGGWIGGQEDKWALASPICHVAEGAPPFLIFHGTEDSIVPTAQSQHLYAALCQAGVPAELHVLPGEEHGFTYDAWMKMRDMAAEFARTV